MYINVVEQINGCKSHYTKRTLNSDADRNSSSIRLLFRRRDWSNSIPQYNGLTNNLERKTMMMLYAKACCVHIVWVLTEDTLIYFQNVKNRYFI